MELQDRVLELVKQGVISSEEAIVLIENNQVENQSTGHKMSADLKTELDKVTAYAKKNQNKITNDNFDQQFSKKENKADFFSEEVSSSESTHEDDTLSRKFGDYVKSVYSSSKIKKESEPSRGLGNQSFNHEFYYPEVTATNIDFKVANGVIHFKTWEKNDFKVEAAIKLYGQMSGDTPFESFLERSQIDVLQDKIVFHVPNKRIKSDLTVYLPEKVYDHISVKLLNGDVQLENLETNDCFIKSTNGDQTIDRVSATMMELEGINGNTELNDVHITDVVSQSVNGNCLLSGDIQSIIATSGNGDVTVIPSTRELNNVDIKLGNGTIYMDIPQSNNLEGFFKTNFGSIKTDLSQVEIVRERQEKGGKQSQLRRIVEKSEHMSHVRLALTTGNIYLKDGL